MCRVFVSGRGNVFGRAIADHLVEAVILAGHDCQLVIDALPEPGGDPLQNLVVAPHELFDHSSGSERDRRRAAAASVCVNTTRPGTPPFDLAMSYASCGPVVLDLNRSSLAAHRRRGVTAVHLPLGCTPSMEAWAGDNRQRGVDIALWSDLSARSEQFVAGAGGMLWEWRTDLRYFGRSLSPELPTLADARLLLNVHCSDDPLDTSFDWAGAVQAIANGCVVVSERSIDFEPLVPGEHFVMAPLEHLAEHAVALAFDEPRRLAMAEAAYKLATTELSQTELLQGAMTQAAIMAKRGTHRARRVPLRPRRRHSTAPQLVTGSPDALAEVRQLKAAYLAQLEVTRSIEASISLVEHGDSEHADITSTSTWQSAAAEVSVVIPVFNQVNKAGTIAEAACSVIAAGGRAGPQIELIIVDDHSTDDSRAVAERLLEEIDWCPAVLIARSVNGGAAAARNTGFAAARAPYVLAVDADSVLYPTGLRRLVDQLAAAPIDVVAAYGMIERFDTTGSLGLDSQLPWDPELLVRGGYIDAMALFRRSAWTELGGYPLVEALCGWEHHDLWLSVAESGRRAELVRSIVGRRHEPFGTAPKISDVDVASTFALLRERHPRLPWPS